MQRAVILATMIFGTAHLSQIQSVPQSSADSPMVTQATSTERSIRLWSSMYNLDPDYMVRVARCESNLDPDAVGHYGRFTSIGVFQWMWPDGGIWQITPDGQAGLTPWDMEANIRSAAWAFANGYAGHWSCA